MADKEKRVKGDTQYIEYPDGEKGEYIRILPQSNKRTNFLKGEVEGLKEAGNIVTDTGFQRFEEYGNLRNLENAKGELCGIRKEIYSIYTNAKEGYETAKETVKDMVLKRVIPAIGLTVVGAGIYEKFTEIALNMQEAHPYLADFPGIVGAIGWFAALGGITATAMWGTGAILAGIDAHRHSQVKESAKLAIKGENGVDLDIKDLNKAISDEKYKQEFMAQVQARRDAISNELENGTL